MLRVHFTSDDLTRVRIAPGVDPLWETLLSAHLLQKEDGSVFFGQWRRPARERLRRLGSTTPQLALLLRLMPPYGYSPDFLTPATGTVCLEQGLDTVLSAPKRRIADELRRLAAGRALPPSAGALADGDLATLHGLGDAVRAYHSTVLAPYWPRIGAAVSADRHTQLELLARNGLDQLLRSLIPGARWEFPVWQLPFHSSTDLYLDGRGLTLVPSFFCWLKPTRLLDPDHPPVLAYPVTERPDWLTPHEPSAGLAALLGRTRLAVLDCLAQTSVTTSELAARVGISVPTASQHATALREAGLVVSIRQGKAVQHGATSLGLALLNR